MTLQTVIRPADVARIRADSTPFREAVADQIERYPRFQDLGYTYLHDPLAVALLLDSSLGRYESMRIEVETGGRVAAGMTIPVIDPEGNNPVRVALDVDVARAEEFIVSRLPRHDRHLSPPPRHPELVAGPPVLPNARLLGKPTHSQMLNRTPAT